MHRLDMGCQLRVNTIRAQVCDGRTHDDEENKTYWGVRNNDNLNQQTQRHHSLMPVAYRCFMGSDSGFMTAPGSSRSSATPRQVGKEKRQ